MIIIIITAIIRAYNYFFKKETLAQVFSCEFCEIFKNTFFKRKPPVAASKCRCFIGGLRLKEGVANRMLTV